MRFVKHLVIGLVGLSVVILAISSLLPRQVMTSEGIYIHAPKEEIMKLVQQVSRWSEWNLLVKGIPDSNFYGDSTYVWKDSKGGMNRLRLTERNEKGIVTEIHLGDQRPFVSGMSVEQRNPDSVQVVWFVIERLKWYPWEKVYGMMAGDMKKPTMKQSLENLKAMVETRP